MTKIRLGHDFKRWGIIQTLETYLKIARETEHSIEEISKECMRVIDLWNA